MRAWRVCGGKQPAGWLEASPRPFVGLLVQQSMWGPEKGGAPYDYVVAAGRFRLAQARSKGSVLRLSLRWPAINYCTALLRVVYRAVRSTHTYVNPARTTRVSISIA